MVSFSNRSRRLWGASLRYIPGIPGRSWKKGSSSPNKNVGLSMLIPVESVAVFPNLTTLSHETLGSSEKMAVAKQSREREEDEGQGRR